MIKRIGPRTDPWGTPFKTGFHSEYFLRSRYLLSPYKIVYMCLIIQFTTNSFTFGDFYILNIGHSKLLYAPCLKAELRSISKYQFILWALSFSSNLFLGTLSKAFEKSKYIKSIEWPSSCRLVMTSKNSNNLVRQDLCFIKPCWLGLIRLFFCKWSTILSRKRDSMVLQTREVNEIGR